MPKEWVCERCGEDQQPLHYHPASTPDCYGRWYCFKCLKIVEGYREPKKPHALQEKWDARKTNEH